MLKCILVYILSISSTSKLIAKYEKKKLHSVPKSTAATIVYRRNVNITHTASSGLSSCTKIDSNKSHNFVHSAEQLDKMSLVNSEKAENDTYKPQLQMKAKSVGERLNAVPLDSQSFENVSKQRRLVEPKSTEAEAPLHSHYLNYVLQRMQLRSEKPKKVNEGNYFGTNDCDSLEKVAHDIADGKPKTLNRTNDSSATHETVNAFEDGKKSKLPSSKKKSPLPFAKKRKIKALK